MRSFSLVLLVLLMIGVWTTASTAGEPPVPIEGLLLVSGWDGSSEFAYFMEGWSDIITPTPLK